MESSSVMMSTNYDQMAGQCEVPYVGQDAQEISQLVDTLQAHSKSSSRKKGPFRVRKNTFNVENSPTGIVVTSWKFQDHDYKKKELPTYARGLFTATTKDGAQEIVVRGYDKFFNNGEVRETKWNNILTNTRGPYELSLKENGCIIFISGLEDDTLLVCSKHATGSRSGAVDVTHAGAGEAMIEAQLEKVGKTKADLARELRSRNATAVAELCDDGFEEHILPYPPELAGLYLHGINLNVPKFRTYPSALVQKFAADWGFVKTGLIMMDDIAKVKSFLEEAAETGAHGGRDVEGFVIRCQESPKPGQNPFHDWFFKYKFEEPYLMYRQWREVTKAVIAGNNPKIRKHKKITTEYLAFAKARLAEDKKLAKDYMNNHGIIPLRNAFLDFKHMAGSDAAKIEEPLQAQQSLDGPKDVSKGVVLAPIATIGCGKTTVAVALCKLFGWSHVQNDNIQGKGRPGKFVKQCLAGLKSRAAVIADRNNTQKRERAQLIDDVRLYNPDTVLVALHFAHQPDMIEDIRRVTRERVIARGNNHQTIQAATDEKKFLGVMDSFLAHFEPANDLSHPDDGFDLIIDLDPVAGSRQNLEVVINELHTQFPRLVPTVPAAADMNAAIQFALEYKPDIRHSIPDKSASNAKAKQPQEKPRAKKEDSVKYFAVDVPTQEISMTLEKAFQEAGTDKASFYTQLKDTRRVQAKFHVTLIHRAAAKDHTERWDKYIGLQKAEAERLGTSDAKLGQCEVFLERVVFDDRIMAIVARLADPDGTWETVNRVAHITVGTANDSIKPKESNDLLVRWLEEGSAGNIQEVVFENKVELKGSVHAVMSR